MLTRVLPCRTIVCHSVPSNTFWGLGMDEKLLTLDDLADYLNVSRRTTYRLLKGSDLPAYRIGGHLRFRREDIDLWIDKQRLDQKKTG